MELSGLRITSLMRQHNVTVRELAAHMNITLSRVREVRIIGVKGYAFCFDWREGIATCAEKLGAKVTS